MLIDPDDVAGLPESTLQRMTIAAHARAGSGQDAGALFWRRLARALVAVIRERRRPWLLLELELMNDPDDEGEFLGSAVDQVPESSADSPSGTDTEPR